MDSIDNYVKLYTKKVEDSGYRKLTPRRLRTRMENIGIFNDPSYCLKEVILEAVKKQCPTLNQSMNAVGCVLIAIIYDRDLRKLSYRLGFSIPEIVTTSNDTRTHQVLVDTLKSRGYMDAIHLTREELLTLDQKHSVTGLVSRYTDPPPEGPLPKNMFPLPTGSFPPSVEDVETFRKDAGVRQLVIDVVIKYMKYLGYSFVTGPAYVRVTKESSTVDKEWPTVIAMVRFLVLIDMLPIALLIVLALCKSKRMSVKIASILASSVPSMIGMLENPMKPIPLSGLKYSGNSCYMDSLLMVMFSPNSDVIKKYFIDQNLYDLKYKKRIWKECELKNRNSIQQSLKKIYTSIFTSSSDTECGNLRKTIKLCPGTQEFGNKDTQDAGEFAQYLFGLFQVDPCTVRTRSYGGRKGEWLLAGTAIDHTSSPIVDIEALSLVAGRPLEEYLKRDTVAHFDDDNMWTPSPGKTYKSRRAVIEVLSSSILVFNVLRVSGDIKLDDIGNFAGFDEMLHETRVGISETIIISKRTLSLTGIVINTGGGHYIATYKAGGYWYRYDDNPGGVNVDVRRLKSFDEMISIEPSPSKLGTLFFYT
jgi:ubiquitin C-terminal hydrolase